MFGCILEHPLSHIVVLDAVDGRGLEPPPAEGDDEGVASLEDPLVPAMLLQPHPDVAETPLPRQDSTHYHRVVGIKVLHKFTWHSYKCINIIITIIGYLAKINFNEGVATFIVKSQSTISMMQLM